MNKHEKEVTIYDIAKHLGLSPSTISRALKGHVTVNSKTQKKITSAAEAMGYRSNTFAANLRAKRTNTIGLIVPRLNSNLMSDVIAGIENITNEFGYNLIISQSLEHVDKEIRNVKTMFANRVDGLLVSLAANTEDIAHFNLLIDKGIPVLFFDRVPKDENLPSIIINNEQAGYIITKHLIEEGAKNIVHISGNQLRNVYADRFKGYKRALDENNIGFKKENLIIKDLSENAGIEAAREIIKMKADAVFVANDNCAASCLNELKRLGIKIPHDIAIAGFNNDIISRAVDPALTTIDYPGVEMGKIAAKNLLEHLAGKNNIYLTTNITIKSKLIIRLSSKFKSVAV